MGCTDTDLDGFLEPSTRKVLATDAGLRGGIELTPFEAKCVLYAFGAETNSVFEVKDLNNDGFPETVSPFPATFDHVDHADIQEPSISDDGTRLYGTYFGGAELMPLGTENLVFENLDSDGFLETSFKENVFGSSAFVTAFVDDATAGLSAIELHAPCKASVEVHRVTLDGTLVKLLGSAQANDIGTAVVVLNQPLVAGDLIATVDLTNGIQGPAMVVFTPDGSNLFVDRSNISARGPAENTARARWGRFDSNQGAGIRAWSAPFSWGCCHRRSWA